MLAGSLQVSELALDGKVVAQEVEVLEGETRSFAVALKTDDHGGGSRSAASRCPSVTTVWQQPYLAVNFS